MLTFLGVGVSDAQIDVSVSATVESVPPEESPTQVIFKGLAYPSSDVTVRQNGTILATVPADPQARFEITVTIDPGMYTFTVFGDDAQGRVGRASTFNITLSQGTTTTISGIFLAPTIEVTQQDYGAGDTITVLGVTAPQSEVNVLVASDETMYPVNADGSGLWSLSLIATDLGAGGHTARAKAVATDNSISEFSSTITFTIQTASSCDAALNADINCDGRVDLIDFSILLFYWQQTNPANPRADINRDTTVDLTDFSILLYHWTG